MTNGEKQAVMAAAERIKSLASLENARLDIDTGNDKYIKEKISPYMQWFEIVAEYLEELANAENGYEKKMVIEKIQRYCY